MKIVHNRNSLMKIVFNRNSLMTIVHNRNSLMKIVHTSFRPTQLKLHNTAHFKKVTHCRSGNI